MSATSLRNTTTKSNTSEMIQSTAHPSQQASHKPRPQKRSADKQRLAQVKIVRDPGKSIKDFPDKDGDWWFFRVEHLNSGRDPWTINCREWQRSWVLQQQESNMQLQEGFHFNLIKNAVQVENGWETRHVLDGQFCLAEPEPEEMPMRWAQPGNEVPVVPQQAQVDPPEINDPVVNETLRRWDMLNVCCKAAGIEIPPEQKAKSMRALMSGTLIDQAMGRLRK